MTRTAVFWMLGDPKTLSDCTKDRQEEDSFTYPFYNKASGVRCYIVKLENDRVTHVHGKPRNAVIERFEELNDDSFSRVGVCSGAFDRGRGCQ
jgi:hypothetical protein